MATRANLSRKFSILSDTFTVSVGLSVFFLIGITFIWVGAYNAQPMTAILWALACYVMGALIGFLFGIPRVLQGNSAPPVTASPTTIPTTPTPPSPSVDGYDLRVNTNLEQISDWLTKIIVGLGLVELRTVPARLKNMSHYVASGLHPSMEVFAGGLIVYFSILGFMGAYLITRLYITGAFSRADRAAMKEKLDEQRVVNIDVPAIGSPNAPSTPGKVTLSQEDEQAAKNVVGKPLSQLVTPTEKSIWAKAQLTLGNYKEAVSAYGNVINQLSEDPAIRFAYSTALYYTGAKSMAFDQLLEAYNRLQPTSDKTLRMNIYRSITYQALYLDPPKSFDEAIRYGEEYVRDSNTATDPGILVNLAAGYGQKMRWLHETSSENMQTKQQTRDRALEIVKQAASQGEGWKRRLQELMDKNFPEKNPDENDLEVFADDPEFRAAVGLPIVLN